MMLRPHIVLLIPAVLLASALTLAACGGGGSGPQPLIVYEAKSLTDNTTNVWTIDAKTGASKQLTFGESFDGNPGWSPDHKRIIFSSDRDSAPGKDDLYVMNADGSSVTRLTNTPDVTEWSAKFSPDGKRVAYVAAASDGYYLALMDPDGSNQQRVAGPYRFAEFPAWRRDGVNEVFFSAIEQSRSDADIYSYDLDTHEVQTRISTPAADVCPHFTHDGKTLFYASVAPGESNQDNVDLFTHDLSSADTSGAHDTRLTDDPGTDDYGNPSPDDKQVVFISTRENPGEAYDSNPNAPSAGNTELYLMDRDGKNQRPLTHTPNSRENVPDW
jgi:Tol biopolymer transport system component